MGFTPNVSVVYQGSAGPNVTWPTFRWIIRRTYELVAPTWAGLVDGQPCPQGRKSEEHRPSLRGEVSCCLNVTADENVTERRENTYCVLGV